jgi:hypothetical protein
MYVFCEKTALGVMTGFGTSQPWQLPRRTAGHGSKADAGAQPLAGCQSASTRIAELEQEIDQSADRRHRCGTRTRMPELDQTDCPTSSSRS